MPAVAKAPEDRQRRNRLAVLDNFVPGTSVPLPPAGLPADLLVRWGQVWTSPIAQLFDPVSDLVAVSRLFTLYALGARLDGLLGQASPEVAVPGELVEAVAARAVFNSTVGARVRVATEVRMLEAQLGLSPRSRLVLGLTVLAGRKAARGSLDDAVDDADDFDAD